MFSTVLTAVPLMAVLTIVQVVVLPRLGFFEADPSLPFLFALAWSLLSSVEEGLVWGFIAGLFMDIFTIAPVGGLSLTYMMAILAVSLVSGMLPANRVAIPLLAAIMATVVQQILYALYLRLFGLAFGLSLASLVQIVVLQAVLILPIYWLLNLIQRSLRPRPVQI